MKKNDKSINKQSKSKKMSVNTTKKSTLSTKNMTERTGRIKPVLDPGNHVIRINDITFDQTPYDTEAWNILLHVESEPVEGEFEGFLTDVENSKSPRYKGQVGRVRFTPWPFKDATLPSGREINRNVEVLYAMMDLAKALGLEDDLNNIEVDDHDPNDQVTPICDYMAECRKIFSNSDYFNACIGGREWENKEGYVNNDLFLPRKFKGLVPIEGCDVENSKLIVFNKDEHIKPLKKKNDVPSFEPPSNGNTDFEL